MWILVGFAVTDNYLAGHVAVSMFLIFFNVTLTNCSTEADTTSNPGAFGYHPLLAPCLDGLAKFTQQLDLGYIGDLMNYLKKLASSSSVSNNSKQKNSKLLTVSERLRCCLVAFKVMRSNLNALNVDLQDFFVQLYNLILEYRPGRFVNNFFLF